MESGHPGPGRRKIQIPISTPPSVVVDVYDHDNEGDTRDCDRDERVVPSFDPELISIDIDEPDSLHIHRASNSHALRNSSTSNLLCPPTSTSIAMNADEPSFGNAVDSSSTNTIPSPRNPFNFQTQVISTSPVKPVCLSLPCAPARQQC
jgi:hypothetical protein